MSLLEPDVRNLGALAGVPAERCPPEPSRVVDQEEDELERVGEADEVELGRCGERHGRVVGVEGAAEAGVGGALRGHEQMFAYDPSLERFSQRVSSSSRRFAANSSSLIRPSLCSSAKARSRSAGSAAGRVGVSSFEDVDLARAAMIFEASS
jgi:hypothetical protein